MAIYPSASGKMSGAKAASDQRSMKKINVYVKLLGNLSIGHKPSQFKKGLKVNFRIMIPIFKQYVEQGHSSARLDLLAISESANSVREAGRDVSQTTDDGRQGRLYVGRKGSEGNDAIDRQADMRMEPARSVNERPFNVLLSQRHRRKSGVKWTCANDDDCDDCGLGGLCLLTYRVAILLAD